MRLFALALLLPALSTSAASAATWEPPTTVSPIAGEGSGIDSRGLQGRSSSEDVRGRERSPSACLRARTPSEADACGRSLDGGLGSRAADAARLRSSIPATRSPRRRQSRQTASATGGGASASSATRSSRPTASRTRPRRRAAARPSAPAERLGARPSYPGDLSQRRSRRPWSEGGARCRGDGSRAPPREPRRPGGRGGVPR